MAAVTPESGTGTTISATTGDSQRQLPAHGVARLPAPRGRRPCCRAARNTRARRCSSTAAAAGSRSAKCTPSGPTITSSPGLTSRSKVAPIRSKAQVSEAKTMVSCLCAAWAGNAAHGQRPEAARIAGGKDAVGREHDQRKSAFHAAQCVGHGFRQSLLARERDQVHDDFGVAVGLENRALLSNWARTSCALTRLPLCASAIMPLFDSTMMGWALSSAESPVVE